MKRSQLDRLISSVGLIVAVVLLAAAGGLFYAHNFIHKQVHDQLAEQKIEFPPAGSPALAALPAADKDAVSKYAGQPLLTGAQAEVYADHFINAHLEHIGGGKTYAELSSAAMADPTNTALQGQVNTVFKGETLRGLLLNAYAFDTMATVARLAAFVSLIGGVLLVVLAMAGFGHAAEAALAAKKKPAAKRRR